MIELDEYDVKLINELIEKGYSRHKLIEIEDVYYIKKNNLIDIIENIYGELGVAEETIVELSDKIEEIWKEKQGSWYDSYVFMKTKYEELEEKLETIKSTLNEDMYDKLNERGVEL